MESQMSVMGVFNDLRLERKLCDVVIEVNGVPFSAHKNILCACSEYFRILFTSEWSIPERLVYNMPGTSSEIVALIIQYAYTHFVPITAYSVVELLATADQFRVTGIIRSCCDFLQEQLCLENCIDIWRLTETLHCPGLRQTAWSFILQHFEEVVCISEDFLELPLGHLMEILQQDELNAKQESSVFEAVVLWIAHKPEERKGFISVLLPKVRLGLMSTAYFMTDVKNHQLLKDIDCKAIINNALKAIYEHNLSRASNRICQNLLARPRLPSAILFAIGGWSGGGPTNGIEVYDVRADHWTNVANNGEGPRAYHGAVFLNGFIYCIGGYDGVDYFSSMHKFNLATRTWHEAAPMHSPRCYVSVTVLNGYIYALGGFNGHTRLNTAERYSPETNQWTLIPHMHEQRSDASATALDGKVYICGGFNGNDCLQTAECYDPESNQWYPIEPMETRRSGIGVIAYGRRVFAVGGFDGVNRLHSAEAYNPQTNSWTLMPSMNLPRSNFGIEVVDDMVFVVGGFNGMTTTYSVECYDERTEEWYDVRDMEIYRSALSCCVVQGQPNLAEYLSPRLPLPLTSMEEESGPGLSP